MNKIAISDADYKETSSYKKAVSVINNINADSTFNERLVNEDTFPLGIRTYIYKYLIEKTVNCHWHDEFEYGILLEGNIELFINDTHINLKKGEIFFINSNILHKSRQARNNGDAVMYTLTFPASLLSSNMNSVIYLKYFLPLSNNRIEGFKIISDSSLGTEIKEMLMKIYRLESSSFGYELECLGYLNRLWLATLGYMNENRESLLYRASDMRHPERMKKILSHIHRHYNEKITAADIANHVNVSRGECFRCFKHYMNKTLVEYINEYRLHQAAKLLRETDRKIISIGSECGFENASYFNKAFKAAYSMTPFQYRKAQIWTSNIIRSINGYDYEYWKDSGNGTMIVTANAGSGSFSCEWHNINNIVFRSGKKFKNFEKTHKQLGSISLEYDAVYNSDGSSFLCVYGWTVDPLVEWYIVECYTAYKPSVNLACLGAYEIDGGTYEIFCDRRTNKPSVIGVENFSQYWSIRANGRFSGSVDVSAHFRAWENTGFALGNVTEISLSVEGWQSSGNAVINTNKLTM